MEVIIEKTSEQVADKIVGRIKNLINRKRNPVICFPRGETPKLIFKKMIEGYKKEEMDFSETIIFSLEEYLGLTKDHPESIFNYFKKNLLDHTNFQEENMFLIDGKPSNIVAEFRKVEEATRDSGGIDLQILGIGEEGHIGMNEPGSSLSSRTRVKPLTSSTIEKLSSTFKTKNTTPEFCITMGIGTIMDAKEIALVAYGKEKAKAIKECVEGPVTASFPASIIQMHPKAKIFLDDESSSLLERKEYYKWAYTNKNKIHDYLK